MNFQKVTSSMKTTCGSINRTFRIPSIVLNSSQLSSHPSQIILSLCYTPPPSISAYNTTSHFRHLLIPQTHHLFQALSQTTSGLIALLPGDTVTVFHLAFVVSSLALLKTIMCIITCATSPPKSHP